MTRFTWRAVASVMVGLLLGAGVVLGVTLVAQGDTHPAKGYEQSPPANWVEYGDRCYHGHCVPKCYHGHCLP